MKPPVLIVDDKPENLLALEAVLRDLDVRLVRAASGEEALLRVLDQDFAVILLDVQMPRMDGYETAGLIRQRERSKLTPIIFITASIAHTDEWIFKGYRQGAVDYIFKPFQPEILKAKVHVFVDLFLKEKKLEEQADELKRSNQELEQFAYVASHDLREPLRKIIGFSQLIEEKYKGKLDDKADGYLKQVVDSAGRMQALIADLLEYSRAGRGDRELERVSCDKLLEDAIENLGVLIQESRGVVTHDELPAVRGDKVQLSQVFQNLVGNALKFRKSGDSPTVHVGVRSEDGSWIFSVKDNGIGIDPKYQDAIFTVFKRLHSRDQYPGTGIGLAICKKVVERHGGRIWFESEAGKGTTFLFTIPKEGG